MVERSWRWLRVRIVSLLDRPPRFFRFDVKEGSRIASVPSTRFGYALNPPTFE